MKLPSRWPRKKKQEKTRIVPQKKRKVLVISWWGFRWTYALWILKAIEEKHIDKEIDAIY